MENLKHVFRTLLRLLFMPLLAGAALVVLIYCVFHRRLTTALELSGMILLVIALSQYGVASMENSPRNPRNDPLRSQMIRKVSSDADEKRATLDTQAFLITWAITGAIFLFLPVLLRKFS